ncbi:Transposase domain protein [Rickettsiales endosymbiont of Paramecium tredecaurelia]|uniref:hypothetical protein n=1 Tax=Candidatus Sarmatiella mevalonica TaxID=2770581 RepID=UPI001921EC04|nr:hypothetical protein [Candidatus Sarmatiella mevalonica]MBL3284408.1 Transposase domain protein [Candidatus Sarmatiella mevalonica]
MKFISTQNYSIYGNIIHKNQEHPRIFLRLFGISCEEFDILVRKLEVSWAKKVVGKYKRPGRFYVWDRCFKGMQNN